MRTEGELYKAWRKAVYVRDEYKCQFTDCKRKRLEAHHIIRWVDSPHLRFEVSNGITLCKYHHKIITGKEKEYEGFFQELVRKKSQVKVDRDFFFLIERLKGGVQDNS